MKTKKKKVTHGVSWPNEELLESAKLRATELGLNLSAYINQLVRKDLGWGGVFSAPPIAGAFTPTEPSQTKFAPDLSKSLVPSTAPPLKYPPRVEPLRLVAEDPPKKNPAKKTPR